jgi:hypothetical protein
MDFKDYKISVAPGCFDDFEGTQEELDEFIENIKEMVSSGEFLENAKVVYIDDEDLKNYTTGNKTIH